MGDKSQIQWTDATWNPVTGCSKVSPGCAHCYAERVAIRLWPTQYPPVMDRITRIPRSRDFTDVLCHEDRLNQPLRWRRPRRIFVNSMSDLFHEAVPDAFIDKVFAVMALAPQHTFQILTKRAERMRDYLAVLSIRTGGTLNAAARLVPVIRSLGGGPPWQALWPLPNVWLGVSVENQRFAAERIPLLLQTPAAVRFISAEPLLGPIRLDNGTHSWLSCTSKLTEEQYEAMSPHEQGEHSCCERWDGMGQHYHGLDWVIVGGESGKGARPFDVAWARSIVAQCQAAGVPVFVKQLGRRPRTSEFDGPVTENGFPLTERPATTKDGGLLLRDSHGADPSEWPEDLRVREFPCGC